MATRGGDGGPFPQFDPTVVPPSSNGHRKRGAGRGRALSGVPAGLAATAFLAASIVPRLSLLNLAYFNPWQRPVVACGLGGVAAGATRRPRRALGACLVGAITAALGLWIVYGVTRLQNPVLFVERDVTAVVLADLARLAAFALPSGAVGALVGWAVRQRIAAVRRRRREPITHLPGFEP